MKFPHFPYNRLGDFKVKDNITVMRCVLLSKQTDYEPKEGGGVSGDTTAQCKTKCHFCILLKNFVSPYH